METYRILDTTTNRVDRMCFIGDFMVRKGWEEKRIGGERIVVGK